MPPVIIILIYKPYQQSRYTVITILYCSNDCLSVPNSQYQAKFSAGHDCGQAEWIIWRLLSCYLFSLPWILLHSGLCTHSWRGWALEQRWWRMWRNSMWIPQHNSSDCLTSWVSTKYINVEYKMVHNTKFCKNLKDRTWMMINYSMEDGTRRNRLYT